MRRPLWLKLSDEERERFLDTQARIAFRNGKYKEAAKTWEGFRLSYFNPADAERLESHHLFDEATKKARGP